MACLICGAIALLTVRDYLNGIALLCFGVSLGITFGHAHRWVDLQRLPTVNRWLAVVLFALAIISAISRSIIGYHR